MNDKVFLDTNILVYGYSNSDREKQFVARNIIMGNNSFISTQVLQELTNTITKKFKLRYSDAIDAISESCHNNNLYINISSTLIKACKIAEEYKYSYYDSLIISAALLCDCTQLYSEDMKNNQIINGVLKISNPFKNIYN